MTARDIWVFLSSYSVVLVVLIALAPAMGHRLDEFDYLHALLLAATVTIIRAIREGRS